MTLSPIFRSSEAIEELRSKGYTNALAPSMLAQRQYKRMLHDLLPEVIDERYLTTAEESKDDITFLQEHFFLVLFDSVYRSLGCRPERLITYGLLNLCLKGLVVAGDNLFDGESKMELPLSLGDGRCFASIMQMLCFDQLIVRVLEVRGATFPDGNVVRLRRDVLTSLALIGTLEGSEERGIETILPVDEMIAKVHRVRGGELFSLAFIAPRIAEARSEQDRWETAMSGIAGIGTAFQIVDDLTDFEFDLARRSHNLLSSQIIHDGTPAERAAFERLSAGGATHTRVVETTFVQSAHAILRRACTEAEKGFEQLARIGFWFRPKDAEIFIRAIAGEAGELRMHAVAGVPGSLNE